jgi:hypothetical protein
MVTKTIRRFIAALVAATCAAVALSTAKPAVAADESACSVQDVEYTVVANIVVRDTPFGAADGVYSLGSGRMKLRLDERAGDGPVRMMSYDVVNHLTVEAKVAMLSTKVVTESRTAAARDACEGTAQGVLRDGVLTWTTNVAGYHSDGTMECSGSMCGMFGAPPKGTSPLHEVRIMRFKPFTFSPDLSTFTMPYTLASKSDSPKQTTYLSLSGRRVKQSCVTAQASTCTAHLALAD